MLDVCPAPGSLGIFIIICLRMILTVSVCGIFMVLLRIQMDVSDLVRLHVMSHPDGARRLRDHEHELEEEFSPLEEVFGPNEF